MQTVTLHRTRYAIGLWWQLAAKSGLRQACALAKSLGGGYTFAVIRTGQFGLGAGQASFRGLPSLAATLADKGGSHIYVCRFDEGLWWVCAIKDGMIAADGDWLGTSEDAAKAQAANLRQLLDLPEATLLSGPTGPQGLEALFANSPVKESGTSFGIKPGKRSDLSSGQSSGQTAGKVPGKARLSLVRLLSALSGRNRVRSLASPARLLAVLTVILACGLGLFWLYQSGWFTESDWGAQEARRREILSHPEKYFPRPWLKTAPPAAWASRCLNEMLTLPILDQGWELKSAICNSDNIVSTWDFSGPASFLHLPDQAELLTATTAQRKSSLPPLASGGDVRLQKRDEVARKLYETANTLGLHLTVNWKPKAKFTVQENGLVVPLTSPWQAAEFTLSDVSPQLILEREFYQVLQSIPGLVVQQISHASGRWELKGLCHGQ